MKHRQVRLFLIAATFAIQAIWVADSTPASAQQQPVPVVVGVVNADMILQESKAGKSLKAQADQQQKAIMADYDKQQKLFDDAARKLVAQKDTLSADDLQKKKEDLSRQREQQTKALNDRQRALDSNLKKAVGQIRSALLEIIVDIAKKRAFTLVLNKSDIILAADAYDFTDESMKRLDAKLPSVKLADAN